MKAPYYKVYIGNRDVTTFIESIDYEDATEEDNLITLKVYQKFAILLADDKDFFTGTIMAFQFGFMGGTISELHQARITDIKHVYKERVSMTVNCLDLGTTVKKTTSQKIWENKTTSDIAESIASKFNLKTEITKTTKVWENMPQGNKSDFEFLRYLAKREGKGNMIAYIRNNTLYLAERGLEDDSKITYTYGEPNGTLVSFEPTLKESKKEPTYNQTAVTNVDEKTGEVSTTVIDNDTEEDTGTTGQYKYVYGADKGEKRGEIWEDNTTVGKPNLEPVEDADEAKSLANHTKKKSALGIMTARLVVEGNPLLTPNSIITIKNVANRHLGNWYVNKIRHSVTQRAYTTTCEMTSNGSKAKTVDKAKDVNTSEGGKEVKDEVKLLVVDGNDGKVLGYSSESTTVKKG